MNIKQDLHTLCLQNIDNRIADIATDIETTQESMRSETKSSAGDKYETSREMMQQEINKQQTQLAELAKHKEVLLRIGVSKAADTVQLGSLVLTNNGNFYISAALGKQTLAGTAYFIISPNSPIGAKLLGLGNGDKLAFNGKDYEVREIQ